MLATMVRRSAVTGAEGPTTKRPADRDGWVGRVVPFPVTDFDESLDQSKSVDAEERMRRSNGRPQSH